MIKTNPIKIKKNMKTLVVYYSLTGKTELVAKAIAKVLNADIRKVEEVEKRSRPSGFISGGFAAMRRKGSKINEMNFSLDYDLIFLGTPVWGGKPTPAINTFISKADFENKKVILFVTMGGISGKTIKILSDAIESKGGKIINSFSIRTGMVKDKEIIEKGEEIGRQYQN